MNKDAPSSNEATVAQKVTEQSLAERDALVTTAFQQTVEARLQCEQANERAEVLQRRLDEKEEQLGALQQTLGQRNERIAMLEQLCAENEKTLHAINQDVKQQNLTSPNERVTAMGMVLESLDEPGVRHRISRVTTTLGRGGGNDIAINSTSVSRNHSRIVIASDGACLIDLESTNGCSINDQRVTRQFINDGDVVAIGKVKFKFATGVPPEIDDRSMDETHTLLEDSEIFTPVPKSKALSAHEHAAKAKQK